MSEKNIMGDILSQSPNRRSMLRKLSFAGTALTAAATSGIMLEADPASPSPVDIVQFALHLDYLEAEFYSVATTGQTLEQRGVDLSGNGTLGPTRTQFGAVNFANNLVLTQTTALNIAQDELNHVLIVRNALLQNGITPAAKPEINLDAMMSLGVGLMNEQGFLLFDRMSADIGTTAYAGGAPILNGSPFLPLASRILAVEAQHAANARLSLARLGITSPQLDGADIPPPPTGSNLFSTNPNNGLVATRTPGQILYLLYGNQANVTSGGFFPSGVNGALITSSGPATATGLF
jgi:hypothetical protein